MKKVIFVGNRSNVFDSLLTFPELELTKAYVVKNSYLHSHLSDTKLPFAVFDNKDKQGFLSMLQNDEYDIFVSNGCPFIIPVSRMKKDYQIFINIHPSYLPHLRGAHPINGALLLRHKEVGATMHYMDDGIDTGAIIHQESVAITDDLDLGLLYRIAFELEASAFAAGMKKLADSGFSYRGVGQTAKGSYFSRSESDMKIDLSVMTDDDIVARIRAFGVKCQGTRCVIADQDYLLFDAEIIRNEYLLQRYENLTAGSLLMEYDGKMLVKSRDGLIKIKSFEKLHPVSTSMGQKAETQERSYEN